MRRRATKLYVEDIVSAVKAARKFLGDMAFKTFLGDDKTISAIVRKFEIIGEASKQIPDRLKQNHPDIPWKEMARMRDKLIHHYAEVDLVLLYETVTNDLPKLERSINRALKNWPED